MKTKKTITLTLKSSLVGLCFLTTLFCKTGSLNAQQAIPFSEYLTSLGETSREHLYALAFNEQTTAYGNTSGISLVGEGSPLLLEVNASEFSSIDFSSSSLAQVELIRLRVNSIDDLSHALNFTATSGLLHLNCVLILSNVESSSTQLNNLIEGLPSHVAKCYSISVPN